MKKILTLATLACLGVSAYAADGATIFKKCAVCHGPKADKVYLNKVPPLISLSLEERAQALKEYQAGTRNKFVQGAIMKINLKGMTPEELEAVDKYIETLKK